jgi:hypothetical protein
LTRPRQLLPFKQPEQHFPSADLGAHDIAWFVVRLDRRSVGVLRTLFDPPLLQHARSDLEVLDARVDVEGFVRAHRIAEVGRFAMVAEHRGNLLLAAALMRAASPPGPWGGSRPIIRASKQGSVTEAGKDLGCPLDREGRT